MKKNTEAFFMREYFTVNESGFTKSTQDAYNVVLLQEPVDTVATQEIIKQHHLPRDLFLGSDVPEAVSRLERLQETNLSNAFALVLLNLTSDMTLPVEERLQPISFIKSDSLLILYSCKQTNLFESVMQKYGAKITNFTELIARSILEITTNFLHDLRNRKQIIDELEAKAKTTAQNEELFQMTTAERDVTYLKQTIHNQHATLKELFQETNFSEMLKNERLVYDIRLRDRQVKKMVDVYTNLLENISGLFTDMMNNNLNHLMKYLQSISLVISVPALIGGLWGMNTGGLLFRHDSFGFWVMVVIALLLGGVMAIHLHKKDYSK